MPRFGRKETFIASHYTHGFPQSPVSFHEIQPLTWGTNLAYGIGSPHGPIEGYGYSLTDLWKRRYTKTQLHSKRANVSSYDHFDAVNALTETGNSMWKKGRKFTSAESIPSWSAFTDSVASNDSAARLKTGYLMVAAGIQLGDTGLWNAGADRAFAGVQSGVVDGAQNQTGQIESTYNAALAAVQRAAGSNPDAVVSEIIRQLKRGATKEVVQQRIQETKKQEVVRQTAVEEQKKEAASKPCSETWKGYIPGYCGAAFVFNIIGYGIAAGMVFWLTKKVIRGVKGVRAELKAPPATAEAENPYRPRLAIRMNPSSAANMGSEPELNIALTTNGRRQEQNLAGTAFRRPRRK